jgi:hypothetical protein
MCATARGSFLILATELTFQEVAVTFNVPSQRVTATKKVTHAKVFNI